MLAKTSFVTPHNGPVSHPAEGGVSSRLPRSNPIVFISFSIVPAPIYRNFAIKRITHPPRRAVGNPAISSTIGRVVIYFVFSMNIKDAVNLMIAINSALSSTNPRRAAGI